jgi:hypothetical protein
MNQFESVLVSARVNTLIQEATEYQCLQQSKVELHNEAKGLLQQVPKDLRGSDWEESELRLDSLHAMILKQVGPYWAERLGLED